MDKRAPSPGRLLAMAAFALSCVCILLFLWLSFGGPLPLQATGYRLEVSVAEATTLAQEADVRIAGVSVGKVKRKQLDASAARTIVTLELDPKYAPVRRGARAILRQKTLAGETYVELAPGPAHAAAVADGGRLPGRNVAPTVQFDEVYQAFDEPTRKALRAWVAESARAVDGRGQDLNDAFGNLDDFVDGGGGVLAVLDRQERSLGGLVRNSGRVFGALSAREGELRSLVDSSGETFAAVGSRDRALADSIRILPTFLDESRSTLARLERFSRTTRPLVRELQPAAERLGPTLSDLGALGPDLERLFDNLPPLVAASRRNSPHLVSLLRSASPTFSALQPFLAELNPILAYANYSRAFIATLLTHGPSAFGGTLPPIEPGGPSRHYLRSFGTLNARSLSLSAKRPSWERGNAYPAPNAYRRAQTLGAIESFDCRPSGGEHKEPIDNGVDEAPPCLVQPPSLFDPKGRFPRLRHGATPKQVPAP